MHMFKLKLATSLCIEFLERKKCEKQNRKGAMFLYCYGISLNTFCL